MPGTAIRLECAFALCLLLLGCADAKPAADSASANAGTSAVQPILWDTIFGVVSARADTTCVRTARPSVSADRAFTIILLSDEQRVISGQVGESLAACGYETAAQGQSLYRVNAPAFAGNLGIAIFSDSVRVLGPGRIDVDRDGIAETFRTCTSVEGIHLTAWAGEPLRGRRLWHYYHYVGYDMEPSCSEAEVSDRNGAS